MVKRQKFIDQEVIRLMDPYTNLGGVLIKSATLERRFGSGERINQVAPYARINIMAS